MIKDNELTFEEQRLVQLEILKEIDAVCRRERIKYSLAFGTLLGAIRHQGYIPWDDDLDIMMPYEDMIRLRMSLHSNQIKFYDIDTDKTYGNAFANICSLKTYRKIGKAKERGLGIDVYPIVKIPSDEQQQENFFRKAERLQSRRSFFLKARLFLLSRYSINSLFGYHKSIKAFRDFLISQMSGISKSYYIIAGPLRLRKNMIYNEDLFETMTTVIFEGEEYPAIANYELFLRMRYGNYMVLPPEEERKPYHGQHYYWK